MELSTTFFFSFFTLLDWLTRPIFWLLRIFNKKKLSPIKDDILKVSATKLASLIRKRKISCEEVTKTYIKRIKQVNPIINAVVEDRFDDAIEDAKAVDKLLSETSLTEEELQITKPLLGVPLTVKESCSVKGLSFSVGSLRFKGRKAENDSDVIAKLRAAGAIPLLVSNTPELCMGWETRNHITGKSFNPYNPAYSTAGSSGGEGALLGAAASVIGIGSDLGGSIRIPSHFNGIFGHKPTPRVIPLKGHCPYSSDDSFVELTTLGPMVRYAEDLPLLMNIIVEDPSLLKLNEKVNFSNLRVYSMERIGRTIVYAKVDEEIIGLLEKAIKHLQEVHQVRICAKKFNDLDKAMDLGLALITQACKTTPSILINPETNKKDLNVYWELVKAPLHLSILSYTAIIAEILRTTDGFLSNSKISYYRRVREELRSEMMKELGNDGILLLPTFPTTAFQNGHSVLRPKGYIYTLVFNVLGFPATHIPMGLSRKGLPVGIQVVAAPHQDRLCLAVAKELEKKFGGWTEPGQSR